MVLLGWVPVAIQFMTLCMQLFLPGSVDQVLAINIKVLLSFKKGYPYFGCRGSGK